MWHLKYKQQKRKQRGPHLFWVNFCIWCRQGFNFILSHVAIQLSSTVCWRDCLFPVEWSRHLCWRLFDHLCEGLFLDRFPPLPPPPTPPLFCISAPYTSTVFWLLCLKSGSVSPIMLFHNCFACLRYLGFDMNFKMHFIKKRKLLEFW